ncbi:MAG: hypothetical protein WBP40_04955 [Candidatus Moraniibacteriota bacterium]
MQFRQLPVFAKKLKRLKKKYRSLDTDIEKLEKVLRVRPAGAGEKHWSRLHASPDGKVEIYKVRLSCSAMRGETRFRVIYAHNQKDQSVMFVDFIEIYFKGDQESEDQGLIAEYIREIE